MFALDSKDPMLSKLPTLGVRKWEEGLEVVWPGWKYVWESDISFLSVKVR